MLIEEVQRVGLHQRQRDRTTARVGATRNAAEVVPLPTGAQTGAQEAEADSLSGTG